MTSPMQRRTFITLLGVAAAWPLAGARAQQDGRVRRVAVLVGLAESDRAEQANQAAFREELAKLGWIEGRNLRLTLRFGTNNADHIREYAAELVRANPDVIVTTGGAATRAAQQATQNIPIVFTAAGDAVANGLVRNIARPEGNTTGFAGSEPSVAGKRLELLKMIAPHVSRVGVIFNPDIGLTAPSYIAAIETVAPAMSVEIVKIPVRDAVDIVHGIDAVCRGV
jgi:putative ABC transport system substrate-binding protein